MKKKPIITWWLYPILGASLLSSTPASAVPSDATTRSSIVGETGPSGEPVALATTEQRRIAGRFVLRNAKLIAAMAHPTLQVDDYEAYIDGDTIVLTIEYAPSAILGNRYETRVAYELGSSGIIASSVTRDTAMTGAFDALSLLKDLAADVLRAAREESEERGGDVDVAARALELALSQDISGNKLHLLILRLLWAADEASDDYRGTEH